ncbi:MAG: hypothetical protein LQ338_001424 [Usnochroma carphineum]|nr:MAG: hypothetical protein LQ338_001424 [Usnochroma carphineum]
MSFLRILIGSLFVLLASGLPADSVASSSSSSSSTSRLSRIFQATINLGDFSAPIPIPGGQRIVAKVNNGTIKGQGLSGTIQAGVSVLDLLNNGQQIVNNIRSIGTTPDGLPFLIDESGVGSPADDFARLVSVHLCYANLANQFLFTEATLASDRKSVSTTGYVLLDR